MIGTMEEQSTAIIGKLREIGINFLALDFDKTLVSVHTYGRWSDTSEELATKLRPLFYTLIPLALQNNLCVAVVTFSGQTGLIRDVMRLVFPEQASRIIIRARDNSWGNMGGSRDGKQKYIASAAAEGEKQLDMSITRNTTLLIDDDSSNIEAALSNSVRAILFQPDRVERLFSDIMTFLQCDGEPDVGPT
jgi:hypothetical protein